MWLKSHRLTVGVLIVALSLTYLVLALVVGSQAATVIGVGYTVVVVTASFLVNLAHQVVQNK